MVIIWGRNGVMQESSYTWTAPQKRRQSPKQSFLNTPLHPAVYFYSTSICDLSYSLQAQRGAKLNSLFCLCFSHVVHVRQTLKIPVYSQFSQIRTNSALLWLTLWVPNFFSHKRLKKTCSSNTARKQPSCYGMRGWHYKESQPLILHQAAQLPEMLLFFKSNP